MIALKKKKSMPSSPRTISRKVVTQAELRDMLQRYKVLGTDPEFSRACRKIDRQDIKRGDNFEDRSFSEAVVAFYLKWNVYPIPEYLLNDHNFRVALEQLYLSQGRIKWIPVSPLTTQAEVESYYRQVKREVGGPKKVPDLSKLRVTLINDHLVINSAFHAFKSSDFATVRGSKAKKGKVKKRESHDGESTVILSRKEQDTVDDYLQENQSQGNLYPLAYARAMRSVLKKRWREPHLAPQFRMAIRRALPAIKSLISKPNI